jgi:hypothetical protein
MKKPSRFWRIAAVIFLIGNAAGAIYALAMGEQMHAEMHLALFGAAFVGYAFSRAAQTRTYGGADTPEEIEDPRVAQLQRSVDAMSLELERLGEAQRYREKLEAERRDKPQP